MMFFSYPDPLVIFLYGSLVLLFLGAALYGTIAGCVAVVSGIDLPWRPENRTPTIHPDTRRFGWQAILIGSLVLNVILLLNGGLGGDLRGLIIPEPGLMLGFGAIALSWSPNWLWYRYAKLFLLMALIGLTVALPMKLWALQTDRDLLRTITEAEARLVGTDEMMAQGYDDAVSSRNSLVSNDHTRQAARSGLEGAQTGLEATDQLASRTTDPWGRRNLLRLRTDFSRQITRYEGFVRGLGEKP